MIISKNEWTTDIYPFADNAKDAAMQDRITVTHDGNVNWNHEPWTPLEWIGFMAKMNAAMQKAFDIQRSNQAEG